MKMAMRHAVLAIGLAGCVETPLAAAPGEGAPACGAAQLQGLLGQPYRVLQAMRLAQPFRVIRPGMAVTLDYLPQRLNIRVDEQGIIRAVTCG